MILWPRKRSPTCPSSHESKRHRTFKGAKTKLGMVKACEKYNVPRYFQIEGCAQCHEGCKGAVHSERFVRRAVFGSCLGCAIHEGVARIPMLGVNHVRQ